ncbi:MAG: hypothetical protein P1P89_18275 [Desulfobacterales bacterium]|nr:hypothetical protein [Desulfobacterales bacterium]
MKPRIKGKFTFQSTGVIFVLSALLELFSINSPVPLFGNVQGGIIAAVYHLVYVVLFFFLGFGLYKARPWACKLVFAAAGLYTLDRMVYVLDKKALEIYMTVLLNKYGVAVGIPETGFILKVMVLATVLTVACWWGFAGYTYLRRQYFQQTTIDNALTDPKQN